MFRTICWCSIWNFSLVGYKANYFNLNNARRGSLDSTKIALTEARNSLRKDAPDSAKFLIGLNIKVDYAADIKNLPVRYNQPLKVKSSIYKLAIYFDENDHIVGGKWISRAKPSYVWGPDRIPAGPFDKYLPTFDGKPQTLKQITQYIIESSAKMMPLREIIFYLADKSN